MLFVDENLAMPGAKKSIAPFQFAVVLLKTLTGIKYKTVSLRSLESLQYNYLKLLS